MLGYTHAVALQIGRFFFGAGLAAQLTEERKSLQTASVLFSLSPRTVCRRWFAFIRARNRTLA